MAFQSINGGVDLVGMGLNYPDPPWIQFRSRAVAIFPQDNLVFFQYRAEIETGMFFKGIRHRSLFTLAN